MLLPLRSSPLHPVLSAKVSPSGLLTHLSSGDRLDPAGNWGADPRQNMQSREDRGTREVRGTRGSGRGPFLQLPQFPAPRQSSLPPGSSHSPLSGAAAAPVLTPSRPPCPGLWTQIQRPSQATQCSARSVTTSSLEDGEETVVTRKKRVVCRRSLWGTGMGGPLGAMEASASAGTLGKEIGGPLETWVLEWESAKAVCCLPHPPNPGQDAGGLIPASWLPHRLCLLRGTTDGAVGEEHAHRFSPPSSLSGCPFVSVCPSLGGLDPFLSSPVRPNRGREALFPRRQQGSRCREGGRGGFTGDF